MLTLASLLGTVVFAHFGISTGEFCICSLWHHSWGVLYLLTFASLLGSVVFAHFCITTGECCIFSLWHHYCLCLFCCFTSQVNSYGHGGVVSSPYHTFSWASLNKQLTSTSSSLLAYLFEYHMMSYEKLAKN